MMRGEALSPLKLLEVIGMYKEFSNVLDIHRIIYSLQSEKGFRLGYSFVMYSFGPYSRDLEDDLKILEQVGLITVESSKGGTVIKLSGKGAALLSNASDVKSG
ncbi:MAG: hypothetical protein QXP80_05940 [Zestosphaera sp.]